MMAPRANWKGHFRLAAVSCPVALYTAVSASERIVFNTINRATGRRVRREFVDSETGEAVNKENQVKGYETDKDQYIIIEADELAATAAKSDKILTVSAFIGVDDMDETFFDKPYYLAPADRTGAEVFAIFREGLRQRKVLALAHAVLFRRQRVLTLRPEGDGLIATTLHFDYEARSAAEVFGAAPDLDIKGEMLDLAKHIIQTKTGAFDPAAYVDHYEAALAELVKAKIEGRAITPPKEEKPRAKFNLLQALRESVGAPAPIGRRKSVSRAPKPERKPAKGRSGGRRKAG
jgi:DNA end-binding protein Ku